MKKNAAFSLIELLVVVAIIGILAALMAAGIGNMRASAQEQQCRNNLKQLHDATVAFAMAHDRELPHAQGYDCWVYMGVEAPNAWVSLVPNDAKVDTLKWFLTLHGRGVTESPLAKFSDDLGTGWPAKFAIENGELFPYVGDLAPYACPVMVAQVRRRSAIAGEAGSGEDEFGTGGGDSLLPYRTYAMNAFFGCADSEFGLARPTYDHLRISHIGNPNAEKGISKYLLEKGGKKSHVPEPSRLLLFSEIVPAYKNDAMVARKSSGGNGALVVNTVRGGPSSSDGCLNPSKITDADERIGLDVNWDKAKSGYTASKQGYKFGVHPTGLKKPISGVGTVEIMGSLAVFMDGHIEKVFANTGGEEDGANTAWFYNHGYEPSNKMPKGGN